MADGDNNGEGHQSLFKLILAVSLSFIVLISLSIYGYNRWTEDRKNNAPSQDPTFVVESTTVNSYNVTIPDGRRRPITVINLGIRARNPNPTNSCYFFDFREMTLHVKKGPLDVAQGVLSDFGLSSGSETLVHVEAVGVDDVALTEGSLMRVSLTGRVGVFGSFLDVMCVGVWDQKVDCNVRMTIPLPDKLPVCRDSPIVVDYCLLYQKGVQMKGTRILDPKESNFLGCNV